MATLTSTITISGTINGQKINVTSTSTLEDIYDAGMLQPADSLVGNSGMSFDTNGGIVRFNQNCPSYLMVINRSPSETAAVRIDNTAASAERYMVIPPGSFIVMSEYTNGGGLLTIDASASTITLEGVSQVHQKVLDDVGYLVLMDAFAAFQAAS